MGGKALIITLEKKSQMWGARDVDDEDEGSNGDEGFIGSDGQELFQNLLMGCLPHSGI